MRKSMNDITIVGVDRRPSTLDCRYVTSVCASVFFLEKFVFLYPVTFSIIGESCVTSTVVSRVVVKILHTAPLPLSVLSTHA